MYNRIDGDGLLYLLQLLWSDISSKADDSSLSAVAKSGSYNDLINTPDIPVISTSISGDSTNATAASSLAVYNFVTEAIKDLTGFHAEIVQELPAEGKANVLYLVPKTTSSSQDVYDEYLWVNGAFENVGTTSIDLSGYVQKSEMHALTNEEILNIYNEVKGV